MKCSIASREPVGIGVNGGRGDGEDARALAAAHDAIVVLAAAQRGHPLEVDDRVEEVSRQGVTVLEQRPSLLQGFVGSFWLTLAVKEHGPEQQDIDGLFRVSGVPRRCRGASNPEIALKPACFHFPAINCNEASGSQVSIEDMSGANPLVSSIVRGRKLTGLARLAG